MRPCRVPFIPGYVFCVGTPVNVKTAGGFMKEGSVGLYIVRVQQKGGADIILDQILSTPEIKLTQKPDKIEPTRRN